ncbi:MAG: ribonuclease H-like domain-containing protein [Candidatus Kerfeldbacteria bacterium]|nr:ribonuclease H-like domain-containing protein [Candidatus Kerfeldbacteria bacterium]
MINPQNIIVFDIETQKTFDEVGGVQNREKLGVSYVGVYSYSQQKLFGFFEDDLPILEKILIKEQPLLIGFNSIHFDVPVLQPYFQQLKLASLPQLDILKEIEKVLGHRVKLDNVAQATIHTGKSASGLDAIRWYREGNMDALAKYCLDDVAVTRDVYEYGLRHGRIYYPAGGERRPIEIPWGRTPSIREQLAEAFKKHQQLDIEYFEVDEAGKAKITKRKIEILSFDGERFEAYCHLLNNKSKFTLANVWNIADTGAVFAHQGSLF